MIASTREAVSKVMSELQRDGSIEVQNRRIVIQPKLEDLLRDAGNTLGGL